MNQHTETTPSDSAPVSAVEPTHLQHLDGLLEAFRRESEQASLLFQSAVAKSQETALQRVVEMRGALVEELQGLQQSVLSKAQLDAEEFAKRANASAEEILVHAKAQADEHAERTKAEAQQLVVQAQTECSELNKRANAESEQLLGNAKREAEELLAQATAEADDMVVQANAEADVIIARATTVAAEKVLANRAASPLLVGKGATSELPAENGGSEATPAILSPVDPAASIDPAASESASALSSADLSSLAGRFASNAVQAEPLEASEPVLSAVDVEPLAAPEPVSPAVPEVVAEIPQSLPLVEAPAPLAEVLEQKSGAPVLANTSLTVTSEIVEPPVTAVEMPPPVPATEPAAPFVLPPLPGQITKLQSLLESTDDEDGSDELPSSNSVAQASPFVATPAEAVSELAQVPVAEEVPAPIAPEPVVADIPPMAAEIPPMAAEIPPMAAELTSAEPVAQIAGPVAQIDPAGPFVEPEVVAPVEEAPAVAANGSTLERDDLLAIVSSKTGFPLEMLQEHLDSGTKLDLTPPKVVEIIGDVQSGYPNTPELPLTRIPEFLDLGRLVGFLAAAASASPQVSQPEPSASPEPEANVVADTSPFQLASETPAPSADPDESPFQALEPIAAVPSSPFALAVEAMADSASAEAPASEAPAATPFQAVVADREPAVTESPFVPAEPAAASPFVAVAEATVVPVEAEVPVEQAAPAPVAATPVSSEPDVPVDRHVIRGQVATACGFGLPQLHLADKIHIVPDDRRVAEALRDLLLAEGFQAEVTDNVPQDVCAAIVMNGLSQVSTSEQAAAIQLEAFKAARSVIQGHGDRRGLFVTIQDTGGDFGMSASSEKDAWAGGLSGLARTVAAEWPDIGVKALDVEREGRSAEVLARRILRELTDGGPEVEVGLSSDGTRLTQGLEATELAPPGVTNLPEDGTVIVHGAGHGILTSPVLEMAKRQRQRFALLGSVVMQEEDEDPFATLTDPEDIRRALLELSRHQGEHASSPEIIEQQLHSFLQQREVRRLMRELREAGSNVCYFAVDSTDAGALQAVLSQVRGQWGGVAGLLHACGMREESRIETKTDAQVVQVLRNNLIGAEHLLALTKQDPLQLIGFLSPSLHESGSAGHADYAMSNETLNRIACAEAHRRGANCVIRSINWAFCDDGTVSSQMSESLNAQGIQVIPRAQTGRVIADEFSNSSRGDIQVLLAPRRPSGRAVLHTSYLNSQTEIQVDQANSPQLQDHKVQGVSAVPGVMVMEWFLRNARQTAASKGFLRCRDFQQLQGIALPDYGSASVPFSIVMDSLSSFQWGGQSSVRLIDADGQLRYAALLEQVDDKESLGLTAAPELELERTAWTGSHVYGPGALFHGPAFQVIHRVEGVSPQGALGRLLPPEDAGWPDDTYLFHPAMIDGITQLAFVWGLFTQDAEFFVTSIGEFVQAPQPNYNQALRCVLEGLESSPEYLRLNAYLESDSGETIAVMRNVECHPVPGRSQG